MRPARVIVGIDGSPPSRLALRQAAAEAVRRGVALDIIHAHQESGPSDHGHSRADEVGQKLVDRAVQEARSDEPTVDVTGVAVAGGAAKALLEAASAGDLVVVGSRGHSGFAAALTGSTCQQVAMHAGTSVLVVRGRPDPADGPVVVGHDGSATASGVLETAFAAAAARGTSVTVIRAFRRSMPMLPADAPPPKVFNARTTQAALTDELTRLTRPLTDKYPDVTVHLVVADGDPAQLLVDASQRAGLVVVGSRGHGGFAGLLLGSVGLHLIHHAHCPVHSARGCPDE
jgi:nucleotide-binding universal stress UspA family protein